MAERQVKERKPIWSIGQMITLCKVQRWERVQSAKQRKWRALSVHTWLPTSALQIFSLITMYSSTEQRVALQLC